MPLRKEMCGTFHRTLFSGWNQTITLLKRDDDQREGVVRSLMLFDCRKGMETKTTEPIQADMSANHSVIWHIPVVEINRVGVRYFNALDRIVDEQNEWWQPEATTEIILKLGRTHFDLVCLRVDPPNNQPQGS